ncbi:hypothetical protein [Bacteroides reticulotermitis]|uniref:Uncharacterized protein n=1 Tax=Bacteroides reticulotermitis TaxID=1133319 RepID=A0A840D1Y4_9BACE|nr:hypothetical protein [Bacteroides reticulotermitis]MBB4046487.1 hypothetical protein [Bacteroides reticulotermitis]
MSLHGVRVQESGKSECRSVMEGIRIEPESRVDTDNIIRRESGQTSVW